MTLRCACGSNRWMACAPGNEAGEDAHKFVCAEAEVALQVWCRRCWLAAWQART